jgi:bifunctional DNase/RNase
VIPDAHEVQVEVIGIFGERMEVADKEHRVPLLVLRDPSGRELRVPISHCEGFGVHVAVEERSVPRPLTHDLAVRIIEKFSATLEHVLIDEISANGSHAAIHLRTPRGVMTLDARPGDAVALAIRADAPVLVVSSLLSEAGPAGGGSA